MNKSIRSSITLGVFLVVIFCTAILSIIYSVYYRQRVYGDIVSRLDIALQTAWDQISIDDATMQSMLQENIYLRNVKEMIKANDKNGLDNLISSFDSRYSMPEFFLITDKTGTVLSSSFEGEVGNTWCFSNIIDSFNDSSGPVCTFELMPKSETALTSQTFQDRIAVTSANNNYDVSALVRLIIVPIFDGNSNLIGCMVGGYLINNYQELAERYTAKVPNTYLSIAIGGLRIVSNISADKFIYSEGSRQEDVLIKTTQAGKRYQGKISMSGGEALIDIDPIYNYEGVVIGNMGVGSPSFEISELGYNSILAILLCGVVLMLFSALVIREIIKKFTTPIAELQVFAKNITEKELKPQEIVWNEKLVPPELQELAEDMAIMAKNLMLEKLFLEDKVRERTQQLTETISELEQANSYKSQFLANVSHELRTPLNSIIGFASLLKDNLYGELNDKQSLYVNTIISSGNHLLELINDILEIVKLDRGVTKLFPVPIDLIQLFHEVSNLAFPMLNAKTQKFSITVEDNVPVVTWDKQKIEQVIMNLLSNAVKFTPTGGEISIDAEMSGDYVEITVSDTGIGVPEDMREKVFLAFEQANSSYTKLYQGVGLGLAICKSLVELHCGVIWLEENPKGGTAACILLPLEPFNKDGTCAKSIIIPKDLNNNC